MCLEKCRNTNNKSVDSFNLACLKGYEMEWVLDYVKLDTVKAF